MREEDAIMVNEKMAAMLIQHGVDDYSLWQADIPGDDPQLSALLEKYETSGDSSRGSCADILSEVGQMLNSVLVRVHIVVYNDPGCRYVGMDVFDSFEAALCQFDRRLRETESDHSDDANWIVEVERNVIDGELYFVVKEGYEVFYRHEALQR